MDAFIFYAFSIIYYISNIGQICQGSYQDAARVDSNTARVGKNHMKIKLQRGHRSVNLDKSLGVIANHALILEEGHDGILLTNEGRERPSASSALSPLHTAACRTLLLSITHTHTHAFTETKKITSHRTEIALCHRLSPSQWGPSYSLTLGSDTNDQYNEFASVRQPAGFSQVCEIDLLYKQKGLCFTSAL